MALHSSIVSEQSLIERERVMIALNGAVSHCMWINNFATRQSCGASWKCSFSGLIIKNTLCSSMHQCENCVQILEVNGISKACTAEVGLRLTCVESTMV